MEVWPRTIYYYITKAGRVPYQEWYSSLKDSVTKIAIRVRLTRIERGLFGDCKSVGEGVFELRLAVGPGYRLYFGLKDQTVVVLLCGGDKNSQAKDIQAAKKYWNDFLRRS